MDYMRIDGFILTENSSNLARGEQTHFKLIYSGNMFKTDGEHQCLDMKSLNEHYQAKKPLTKMLQIL